MAPSGEQLWFRSSNTAKKTWASRKRLGYCAITILLIALTVAAYRGQQRSNALAEIHRLGAEIQFETRENDWLRSLLGDKATEALSGQRATQLRMRPVGEVTSKNEPITDQQIRGLAWFTDLETLDLAETAVTDHGLSYVGGLRNLKTLVLSRTQVTSEGIDRLQKLLPDTEILDEEDDRLMPKDHAVIEALLSDLLDDDELRPSLGPNSRILLSDQTEDRLYWLREGAFTVYLDDPTNQTIPSDAKKDLQRRNTRIASLAEIRMANPSLFADYLMLLESVGWEWDMEFTKKYPDVKAAVMIWLPGYSEDGQFALIRFRVRPTDHGNIGTALLKRDGGAWKVLWRSIVHFA